MSVVLQIWNTGNALSCWRMNTYTMLSNSSSKIMFFCTLCYTKIPFALRVEQESVPHQFALDHRLQSINEKLKKMEFCF